MKFGDILRQKREERRMTQTDLAERIGVTQQNINSYETRSITPLPVIIVKAFGR